MRHVFFFLLAFAPVESDPEARRPSVRRATRWGNLPWSVGPRVAMASTESIDDSMSRLCLALFQPDQLWQRAREPLFWLGPTLKLVWVNQAWENLTGYPAESVVGLTCTAHAPSGAGGLVDLATSFSPPPESLAGQPAGTLSHIFPASGESICRRVDFWPIRDEDDSSIGFLGLVRLG